jgi:hypothetical protein
MKTRRKLLVVLAASVVLACSCPLTSQTTPLSPVGAPTAAPPDTAAPTSLPTAIISPTPDVPQVTPISVSVNCRSGPDTAYSSIGVLKLGQTAQIAGRNDDSSWWYIRDPGNPGKFCWVAASVVTTAGSLAALPIIPPSVAIVTQVTVDISLLSPVSCGGPNPMDFSGTIATNGAAKVKYQWEVGGDQSNTTSPETLDFSRAEIKDVQGPGAYKADCGKYTITLHVLSPNDVSASKKLKIAP